MKLIKFFFGRNTIVYVVIASVLCFGTRYYKTFIYKDSSIDNNINKFYSITIGADAADYLIIANTIKEHGCIGREKYADSTNGDFNIVKYLNFKNKPLTQLTGCQSYRPPLWPIILSGMLYLSHDNLFLLFIFRFIIDVLSIIIFCLLINKFSLKKENKNIAIVLFSINPIWLVYSVSLNSEPTTMLFILLFSLLAVNILQKKIWKTSDFILLGLTAAMLILNHPFYILFPFLVGIGIFLLNRRNYIKFFIFYLAMSAPLVLWIIRNQYTCHTNKIFLCSNGSIFSKGWNSTVATQYKNSTMGASNGVVDVPKYYPDVKIKGYEILVNDEMQRYEILTNTVKYFIKDNKKLIPKILLRKFICNLDPFPEFMDSKYGISLIGSIVFRIFSLFSLIIIIILNKYIDISFFIIYISLELTYIVAGLILAADFRFQMPKVGIEMISMFFALEGFIYWLNIKRQAFIIHKER